MAAISAKAVNELRQATGCGLMDCKKALVESEGDFDKAVTILREKGLASQAKKASRIAAEGMAYAAVVDGVGVIVEVNCESDFVAGGPLFAEFVEKVAKTIAKENPADVDALLACPMADGNGTVADAKSELFLSVRENMNIRRFERVEGCVCVPYIHMKGKVAVLVELETAAQGDAVTTVGKDVAMQICALSPQFLDKSVVPQSFIDNEVKIRTVAAKQDPRNANKPDAILEKIVLGGISKMYKEICLLQMPFVKDDKLSVEQYVNAAAKELGAPITVKGYIRFEKGEGIEKRQDDLAAEVAKMVNG
ncbi:MAG: elongation factor Ts [Oscillospiraceae bacterium]|nr:elongation factor Ts [Oscillospiraceae bacterium]